MRKILAFTLAETLIVMGIIGIVSALTLPNLNSSTGEKEKIAKVKKIYRDLNDAYGRATAVYGPFETWFVNDTTDDDRYKRAFERITEFMKISKSNVSNYTATLADGTSIIWLEDYSSGGCEPSSYYPAASFCGNIIVDIDGPNKGKNRWGYDKFEFDIMANGVIMPEGVDSTTGKTACYQSNDEPYGCTRWVIENENMDYLKCNDKLKWGQQTSCK